MVVELTKTDQPERFTRITTSISALPDNVLLEIFYFYLDVDQWLRFINPKGHEDLWHLLVHVCRRWRYIVSASPRRLNLRLLCTEARPVTRNIWPELPISISAQIPKSGRLRSQGVNNVVAALKQHHNRICQITIWDTPNSLLNELAAVKPFSALIHLALWRTDESAPVLPDSFLEGSGPRLQSLFFQSIPFPALGKLLLSTHHLSDLFLDKIPRSGYISPDVLVTSLSELTRLKHFSLVFQSPRSRADRESRVTPSLTRVVLPALASFRFKGDSEYLEDMLSRMDTPLHLRVSITLFHQLVFDTPLLHNLVKHAGTFKAFPRAVISFASRDIRIVLFQKQGPAESDVLELRISCRPSDWQLSSLTHLIASSIPPVYALERLGLRESHQPPPWQEDIEDAQWLEMLRPFSSVKDLVLSGQLAQLVAPILGVLIGETVAEALPALETIFVEGFLPPASLPSPWQKAIERFIAARRISGRPVSVHYLGCQANAFVYP